jgi:LysR family glycine cleavage system transcriptional activator
MSVLPSLRGLQAFESAARTGSFVAAAEELLITAAAVSQLVRGLEEQVGRKLFHRVHRRVVLTEAGIEIYPRLMQAFGELRAISRELAASDPIATLVVSVAPSAAIGWLSSRLPRFVREYGWVDIFLRSEEDPVAFDKDSIDLRLSYGSLNYGDDAVSVARDAVYPTCSPGYLSEHGPIENPGQLISHHLVHTDWGPSNAPFPSWLSWFEAMGIAARPHVRRGVTANSSMAALDLARGGLGIALAQGLYCSGDVESGSLIVVGAPLKLPSSYYITIPQRSRHRAVVAAFNNWFAQECRLCTGSPVLRALHSPEP